MGVMLLAAIGAGAGLSAGLAFNLRLARSLGNFMGATLVNFCVGASTLLLLWTVGVDAARPHALPPLWMLLGGVLGATYVTLALAGASRLGVAVGTVAVTFGQVASALVIAACGWFGQPPQRPTTTGIASATLLLGAVALLAVDRARASAVPSPAGRAGPARRAPTVECRT